MIANIKKYIIDNTGNTVRFKLNNGRNQIVDFSGEIVSAYKSVFIVKLNNNLIRSFSYTDILIGNLVIV